MDSQVRDDQQNSKSRSWKWIPLWFNWCVWRNNGRSEDWLKSKGVARRCESPLLVGADHGVIEFSPQRPTSTTRVIATYNQYTSDVNAPRNPESTIWLIPRTPIINNIKSARYIFTSCPNMRKSYYTSDGGSVTIENKIRRVAVSHNVHQEHNP